MKIKTLLLAALFAAAFVSCAQKSKSTTDKDFFTGTRWSCYSESTSGLTGTTYAIDIILDFKSDSIVTRTIIGGLTETEEESVVYEYKYEYDGAVLFLDSERASYEYDVIVKGDTLVLDNEVEDYYDEFLKL